MLRGLCPGRARAATRARRVGAAFVAARVARHGRLLRWVIRGNPLYGEIPNKGKSRIQSLGSSGAPPPGGEGDTALPNTHLDIIRPHAGPMPLSAPA